MSGSLLEDIDTWHRWNAGSPLDESYPTTSDAQNALARVLDAVPSLLAQLAATEARIALALAEHGHAGPETPWCRSLILHEGTCNCWRAALSVAPNEAP